MIEKGIVLRTREEILGSIPAPANGKQQWPLKSDLEGLTDEKLEDFKLDKFQYWNYSTSSNDSGWNIPFRLFGSDGSKSAVFCSGSWVNSPDSYPNNLITVDMKDVTKIDIYMGK